MKKALLLLFICLVFCHSIFSQPKKEYNLQFDFLPTRWDEALPLGNGTIGALVWQKRGKLRMSLDNIYLWDDRPMPEIDKLTFGFVVEQVRKKDYAIVQKLGDEPYEKNAAPTKIPGAAIEIDTASFGKVTSSNLDLQTAIATVKWANGAEMETFVNAAQNYGEFTILNAGSNPDINIIPPDYQAKTADKSANSVTGIGLGRLGYPAGTLTKSNNRIEYFQPCNGKNAYRVTLDLQYSDNRIMGTWRIDWIENADSKPIRANLQPSKDDHLKWWGNFWNKSSVSIPDPVLAKQYYREMYKFGSVARSNTPPISLQAVWTADNGNLPPWKGDFHHDLNTQMSYWAGYSGNHTDLTAGFTNWLWKVKERNRKWTKSYFGKDGINVPGVTTISGAEMGGWIQYSMSPTTAAWLSQHFYLQWKYGMNPVYLDKIVYPYFKEVEQFYSSILEKRADGKFYLPLSSSPEMHDNSLKAWFTDYTNYDLALLKSFYQNCFEIYSLKKDSRANVVKGILENLPELAVNETGLRLSANENLTDSHRHHSPYMAIYPQQLLNFEKPAEREVIQNSIKQIEKFGTRQWVGYSFSWMASIYAKAKDGGKAADMLRKFATNFVSINSFHLNGDQKGGQFSNFKYRPFTLEGNFAYAQGVHEMLLQTNGGIVEIFPAIPADWRDVSFDSLRTEGGFLISAAKKNGVVTEVKIRAMVDGVIKLKLPFAKWNVVSIRRESVKADNGIAAIRMTKNQTIKFYSAVN